METMDRQQMAELQSARLIQQVRRVYRQVPFYRESLQKAERPGGARPSVRSDAASAASS